MSRVTPLDRALVLILVPLWVVCFGLSVSAVLRRAAIPAVYVSAPGRADELVDGVQPELFALRGAPLGQVEVARAAPTTITTLADRRADEHVP